jgi:hypothetical protein
MNRNAISASLVNGIIYDSEYMTYQEITMEYGITERELAVIILAIPSITAGTLSDRIVALTIRYFRMRSP